jgi:hypothetical protein
MIGCGQGQNECVLKSLNLLFGRIDSMIVWFNEMQLSFFCCKKCIKLFCCLIVHNVEIWFEPLLCKLVKICFIGIEDVAII